MFSEEVPSAGQFQAEESSDFIWECPAIQGRVMSPRFFCTEVKAETGVFRDVLGFSYRGQVH